MHVVARTKFFATTVFERSIELHPAFVDDVLGFSSSSSHASGLQKLQQIDVLRVDVKDLWVHGGEVQRSEG